MMSTSIRRREAWARLVRSFVEGKRSSSVEGEGDAAEPGAPVAIARVRRQRLSFGSHTMEARDLGQCCIRAEFSRDLRESAPTSRNIPELGRP